MEKIKNILGLRVHNECIMDRFDMILVKFAKGVAGKIIGEEDVCPEKEMGHLERKVEISGNEEEKVYGEALRRLAELRPEYKKYLPKRGKKKKAPEDLSKLLEKRIRLAVWVGTGNEIPFGNLNVIFLKNLLKGKGYSYRRKRGEMGWYRDSLYVGKDLYRALEHLEKFEAVDRSRLTVSF